MKQLLIFPIFICVLVVFWACSDDSNPIVQQSARPFDPYTLWDTASFVSLGTLVQSMAVTDTFLFAGTSTAGVYISTNNGDTWNQSNSGLTNLNVRALLASDANVYAGTANGLFRSTDNGVTWFASGTGITVSSILSLTVKDTFLVAGATNNIFRSTDQGLTWSPGGLDGFSVTAFATRGTRLFAATTNAGILRSSNNGANWMGIAYGDLPHAAIYNLAAKDTNLFTGISSYGILRSSNDSTWSEINEGLYIPLTAGAPTALYTYGVNVILGLSNYQGVYLSLNNGTSWVSANAGLNRFSVQCFTNNGYYLFAGGQSQGGVGGVWRHPL